MSATVVGSGLGFSGSSAALLGSAGMLGRPGLGLDGTRLAVNAATGNLSVQRTDDMLAGLAGSAALLRTYNSQAGWDGDNADGWRMGAVQRVVLASGTLGAAGSTLRRTAADGAEFTYAWNATKAAYVLQEAGAEEDRITYSGSGATLAYVWLDGASQTQQSYDSLGRMVQVRDRDGNRVSYVYTGSLLTQLRQENVAGSSSRNETLTLVYDTAAGHTSNVVRIERREDSAADTTDTLSVLTSRIRYAYDASNRLVSTTVDLTPQDNTDVDLNTLVTLYAYDGTSTRLASITQLTGTVNASATDRVNPVKFSAYATFAYYAGEAGGAVGQLKRVTLATVAGQSSSTGYTYAAGSTTVTDGNGQATVLTYDAAKRLTGIRLADGRQSSFAYVSASDDHLASVTDGAGRVTSFGYDALGNRVLERDAAGNTVTRTYSTTSQLLTETRYAVADPDGAGVGQPGGAMTRRQVLDALGRVAYALDEAGRVTRYERNALGQVTATITYAKDAYDLSALAATAVPTQAQLDAWVAARTDKTQAQVTQTAYDWRGQVARVTRFTATDATGAPVAANAMATDYVHDAAGQLLFTVDHRGAATSGVSLVTESRYDGLGRLVYQINPVGQIRRTVYIDANGNGSAVLHLQQYTNAADGKDYLVAAAQVEYIDQAGRRVATQAQGTSDGLALNSLLSETVNTYDAADRLVRTSTTMPSGGSIQTLNLYDATGRLVGQVDGEGSLTEYGYNAADRLVRTTRYATAVDATALATALGAPAAATLAALRPVAAAADATSYRVYDNAGRVVREVDAEGRLTEHAYDGADRLVREVRRAQMLSAVQMGNLAAKAATLTAADPDLAVAASPAEDRVLRRLYDDSGRLVGQLDAAGYLSESQYDAAGRLVHTVRYATQSPTAQWAAGTLATLRPLANAALDQHGWMLYDAAGQRTGEVDAEGYLTETQYDGSGNAVATIRYKDRVAGAGIATLPTLLAAGAAGVAVASLRPRAASAALGDQITARVFNAAGWLLQETAVDGTATQYAYDTAGHVLRVRRAANDATQLRDTRLAYDQLGRVVAQMQGIGSAALAIAEATSYVDTASRNAALSAVWNQYASRSSYDVRGLKVADADALGNRTLYFYDNDGRLTHRIDALGQVELTQYDALGRVTRSTQLLARVAAATLATLGGGRSSAIAGTVNPLLNATNDAVVSLGYDRAGNVTSRTGADGLQTLSRYDAFDEVVQVRRQTEATRWTSTAQFWDTRGQMYYRVGDDQALDAVGNATTGTALSQEHNWSYDAFGRATAEYDGNWNIVSREFDRLGREVSLDVGGTGTAERTSYDMLGRVLSRTDRLGKVTTTAWNDVSRTMTVTSPEGVVVTTTLNRHGQTVGVGNALGTVSYGYDADGRLTSTHNPANAAGVDATRAYDRAGRLVLETDDAGRRVRYEYDALGRVLKRIVDPRLGADGVTVVNAAGLDLTTTTVFRADAREVWTRDAGGIWTRTRYDKLGRVAAVTVDPTTVATDPPGVARTGLNLTTSTAYDADGHALTVTDARGVVTRYQYDNLGRRINQTLDYGPGRLNLSTGFAYDGEDNVVQRTDARGAVTRYQYDWQNRLQAEVDAEGFVTAYTYDAQGRRTATTRYANRSSNPASFALPAATAQDITTRSVYNADGRVQASIDGEGYVTENVWGTSGELLRTIRYAAVSPSPASATAWRPAANAAADRTSYFFYDAAGRRTGEVDGERYVTEIRYDASGLVTGRTRYATALAAAPTAVAWKPAANAAADRSTSLGYDAAGRLQTETDGEGVVTRHDYDAAGHLTLLTQAYGTAEASAHRYVYDAAGRLVEETRGWGTAEAMTQRYVLDAQGNRTQLLDPRGIELAETDSAWALAERKRLGYVDVNAAALLAAALTPAQKDTLRNRYRTQQLFDNLGRMTQLTDALGALIKTEYDANGNAVKVTDQRGNVGYTWYDKRNLAVMHASPLGSVSVSQYDAFGRRTGATRYAAKAQGSWSVTAAPVVAATAPATGPYVLADAAKDAAASTTFDRAGRVLRQTDATGAYTENTYGAFEQPATVRNALGGVTSYVYDRRGLKLKETLPVTSLNGAGVASAVINQFAYDARGNLLTRTEALGLPEQRITSYGYDRENRLKTTTGQSIATYDAGVAGSGAPVETRSYDRRGNLVEVRDAKGRRTLHYFDALDREVALLQADGTLSTKAYDDAGNVVRKTVYGDAVALPATAGGAAPAPVNAANRRETLYTYDADNRLAEERIQAVALGRFDAAQSKWVSSTQDVVTSYGYDATGNRVTITDTYGNKTWALYDAEGRRNAQVDAAGYLTAWTLDALGNATQQTRYATVLGSTALTSLGAPGTTRETLVAAVTVSADDRTSSFTYDKLGRMLTSSVAGVAASTVNATTGALSTAAATATTSFLYNAKGQLRQRTEATGEVTDWTYDALGRQVQEQSPQFTDAAGLLRRRTTKTDYNGLGLVRTRTVLGTDDTVSTDDRITRYTYNAAGWASTETDALGNVTTLAYDLAGNQTQRQLNVKDADGKAYTRITEMRYDALNRENWRRASTKDVATGITAAGDLVELRYDAYGEITGKRTNGGNATAAWQETAEYNALGKVFKTNSASSGAGQASAGAYRLYFYDANGNATLAISSAELSLAGETQAGVLASMSNAATAAKYFATISIYDERNQLVRTVQPRMDSARESIAVTQFTTQVNSPAYSGGSLAPTTTVSTATPGTYGPAAVGSVGAAAAPAFNFTSSYNTGYGYYDYWYRYYFVRWTNATVSVPTTTAYGAGQFEFDFTINEWTYTGDGWTNATWTTATKTYTQTVAVGSTSSIGIDMTAAKTTLRAVYSGGTYYSLSAPYSMKVYFVRPDGGKILMAEQGNTDPQWYAGTYGAVLTLAPASTLVNSQPSRTFVVRDQANGTDRLSLAYRAWGSTGAYTIVDVPKATNSAGAVIAGQFQLDATGIGDGDYEYVYVGLATDGTVLNRQSGRWIKNATPSITPNASPALGGVGRLFFSTGNVLNVTEQGVAAKSFKVYTRPAGSTGTWSLAATLAPAAVGGASTPGWAQWAFGALAGSYEVRVDALDAGGALVQQVRANANFNGAASALTSTPTAYVPRAGAVSIAQAAAARTLVLQYRLAGSTGAFTTVSPNLSSASGTFVWSGADALVADKFANYDYEFQYTALDANGKVLNKAHGTIRLGADAAQLSHVNDTNPTVVQFVPPQSASSMRMQYREKGTFGAYAEVILTPSAGVYSWDVSGLVASGKDYEYVYELRNASGVVLTSSAGTPIRVAGVLDLGAATTTQQTGWSIGVDTGAQATVSRQQRYNAFGEVRQEIDGLGRVTDLSYNTLGKLTSKIEPQTNVTLRNGFVQRQRPTTTYYYDKAGRLVGSTDANNVTNSQLLLDLGDGQQRVLKDFHADGGVAQSGYDIFGERTVRIDELARRTDLSYDLMGRLVKVMAPQRVAGTASYLATRSTDTYEYDAEGNRIAHTDALGHRERAYFDEAGRVTRTTSFAGLSTSYGYAWVNTILSAGGTQTGGWRKTTTRADTRTLVDDGDVFGRTTRHVDLGGRITTYAFNQAGWLAQQTSTAGQNIAYSYYANGYIKAIADTGSGMDSLSRFEYDNEGNRTFEAYSTNAAGGGRSYYQFAEISYDELNRVVKVLDPKAEIRYEYDAVGNRRRVWSYYHDGLNGATAVQDYWYDYDSMNRFVVSMGQLTAGARGTSAADTTVAVVRGSTGVALSYDKASQRTQVVQADGGGVAHTETYSYTSDGYLEDVKIDGVLRARRTDDAAGRVTNYKEFAADGTTVSFQRNSSYDFDNRLLTESDSDGNSSTYSYFVDGTDTNSATGGGELHHVSTTKGATTVTTYYAYDYWDEGKRTRVTSTPQNAQAPGWQSGYSDLSYDVNGHLVKAVDHAGNRTLNYTNDAYGQVMTRLETAGATLKRTNYFYLNEYRIGAVGNDGTPVSGVSYAEALAQKQAASAKHGDFRYGHAVASADFDQNYQPINSTYPAATATSYTVRSGDTLQSIARAVWGDATMWYLIAEANGLRGTETLVAGQRLTIPNKVTNIHNNSQTVKVYDAGDAIGDAMPTVPDAPPPPPKKSSSGGCGAFLPIIIMVVAIVVTWGVATVATPAIGAAATSVASAAGASATTAASIGTAVGTVAGAAVGAAAGAVVSQGLSIAAGLREDFDWGDVGVQAVTAGLTAGIGLTGIGDTVKSMTGLQGMAAQGAMSAVTESLNQGVKLALGMQEKFDWAAVATAAVGSAVDKGLGYFKHDVANFLSDITPAGISDADPRFFKINDLTTKTVMAVAGNAIKQGIGVAAGLRQDGFDAAELGVAAAAPLLEKLKEKGGSINEALGLGSSWKDRATENGWDTGLGEALAGGALRGLAPTLTGTAAAFGGKVLEGWLKGTDIDYGAVAAEAFKGSVGGALRSSLDEAYTGWRNREVHTEGLHLDAGGSALDLSGVLASSTQPQEDFKIELKWRSASQQLQDAWSLESMRSEWKARADAEAEERGRAVMRGEGPLILADSGQIMSDIRPGFEAPESAGLVAGAARSLWHASRFGGGDGDFSDATAGLRMALANFGGNVLDQFPSLARDTMTTPGVRVSFTGGLLGTLATTWIPAAGGAAYGSASAIMGGADVLGTLEAAAFSARAAQIIGKAQGAVQSFGTSLGLGEKTALVLGRAGMWAGANSAGQFVTSGSVDPWLVAATAVGGGAMSFAGPLAKSWFGAVTPATVAPVGAAMGAAISGPFADLKNPKGGVYQSIGEFLQQRFDLPWLAPREGAR